MSRQEIIAKYQDKLCQEVLGLKLVPSDSHEVEEGHTLTPLMTDNQEFYFIPIFDDPVMGCRTILNSEPKPLPNRYHYAIEVIQTTGGGYWQPPDCDLVEVGREESLEKAIGFAAHYQLDQKLNCIGEAIFWEQEKEMEPFIEQYMGEVLREENNF